FIEPIGGSRKKHYQFTAIDDCTRIRVLRIYDRNNQKTAIQFLDYVLEKLPFSVEVIQTDNGAEFQGAFHWHVIDRGIGHVYIRPATPRLNGKVERSHRIDAEEFYRMLEGVVIDNTQLFNDKLQEWEDFYNFDRPMVASTDRLPTNGYDKRPSPRPRNRPMSVAHRDIGAPIHAGWRSASTAGDPSGEDRTRSSS
ncbi:MAG: DDE-type integrase/transposase/recombinase, partial [Acidimicrobiia bacterium]